MMISSALYLSAAAMIVSLPPKTGQPLILRPLQFCVIVNKSDDSHSFAFVIGKAFFTRYLPASPAPNTIIFEIPLF